MDEVSEPMEEMILDVRKKKPFRWTDLSPEEREVEIKKRRDKANLAARQKYWERKNAGLPARSGRAAAKEAKEIVAATSFIVYSKRFDSILVCLSCFNEIESGDLYCWHCGKRVDTTNPAKPKRIR